LTILIKTDDIYGETKRYIFFTKFPLHFNMFPVPCLLFLICEYM